MRRYRRCFIVLAPIGSPNASAVGVIDTGAILALIDRSDKWHASYVKAYDNCQLPLLTTEAVLQKFSPSLSAIFAMPGGFGSSCVPAAFRRDSDVVDRT